MSQLKLIVEVSPSAWLTTVIVTYRLTWGCSAVAMLESIVPLITPVLESILRPAGRL